VNDEDLCVHARRFVYMCFDFSEYKIFLIP
jgi:hypothetical protein